jgi:hypothetical protein
MAYGQVPDTLLALLVVLQVVSVLTVNDTICWRERVDGDECSCDVIALFCGDGQTKGRPSPSASPHHLACRYYVSILQI